MKRSKKPLTFTAIAASIGALSLAVEGCVYGPPQETVVYGPPPDETTITETKETDDTDVTLPASKPEGSEEVGVYGPPPDETLDGPENDVYGPPPDETFEKEPEVVVYGPAPDET
jgi:hypothetical protein